MIEFTLGMALMVYIITNAALIGLLFGMYKLLKFAIFWFINDCEKDN